MGNSPNAQRRREIIAFAREHGQVQVTDLAARLGVATETIRRDLTVLEQDGLVRRIHGAAYPLDGAGFESTLAYRSSHMVPEKRRIAAAVMERIGEVQSVYIDEGYTPQLVAELLANSRRPLTVVTPSLPVAAALSAAEGITIMLGGNVRGRTLGTVGHWVIEMLSALVVDLAIMGTNGISPERGLTTPEPTISAIKRKVMDVSRRRLLVGVHVKFGVDSFARFADVGEFDALVTDRGLRSVDVNRTGSDGGSSYWIPARGWSVRFVA
ncbi:DNA-binding transcriptional regulator of sugar metabolism, DeoR/GlpR family [Nakamurella panacisegetis]|uniref:Lactose phosphotransferase system repressor n=1 Tax=Nakamurella panacisegetis TaxID=1090615 RepID=A0A1H0REB9_9ACTN|nr:DeoR/GlpR family DNA-binding transcription regulator [Nakamurella panacisegetis]SDP27761.1 DNA-binding transcriptional regulator of sugar metabolism, DeoR/GlpR family [Nakamurella panacisegetis]